jgi:pimeloyl-ACP methyl ester carboxylesterase
MTAGVGAAEPAAVRRQDGTAYRRSGRAGRDLVLIHGVGLDHTLWEPQLAALEPAFEVLRYDLLCHGGSAVPEGQVSLDDFAGQLARLLDGLGIERPVSLVGFSLGGLVARHFAARHPARVGRLVLLSTVFERDAEQQAAIAARFRAAQTEGMERLAQTAPDRWFPEAFRARHPRVVAAIRRRLAANDPAAYIKAYRVFTEAVADERATLAAIACPTLVATGELDPNSTPDMTRAMARLLPNGRPEILPGLRHMAGVQDPELVNRALLDFLLPEGRHGKGEPET